MNFTRVAQTQAKKSTSGGGGAFLGALALAGAGLIGSFIFQVPAGHRAIIFDRFEGVKPNVYGEGIHFVIPLIQYPIRYEIRTRFTNIHTETGSKDLQTVGITLRLLFKPDVNSLPVIHQRLGPDYDERVLPSISNEVLKAVVAQYDAGELITQREIVSSKIREALTSRAAEFNINLDDVSITHVSFSPEFSSAIEAKQVASQEAERSKFVVMKAEQEKRAAIIRAQGEAEAARLISEAMKGTGFIELRKIEAMREVADSLSKSRNVSFMPGGANMLIQVPPGSNSNNPPTQQSQN